ncbi:tripartite tricarboxylate transporter TctB family protein [Chloroflexota bacterium]
MKKIKGEASHYLAVMIIMVGFIGVGLGMDHFLAKLVPLTIAGITFILATAGMAREIWGEARPEVDNAILSVEEVTGSLASYLVAGAIGVSLIATIYLLGIPIAAALFILSTMKILGVKWKVVILFTVVTPALIYVLVEIALQVELYRGLLFSL